MNNRFHTSCIVAGLAGLVLFATPAAAEGNNIVKTGVMHLGFQDESTDLAGAQTPPGLGVDVQSTSAVSLNYSRLIGERWSVDVMTGLPFDIEVEGEGNAEPLGKVAEATISGATLSLSYYFTDRDARWRPYVSAGYNYSVIHDEKASASLNAALSGETDASFSDSQGLGVYAGLNYALTERWLVAGSVGYQKAQTDVTLVTDTVVDMGAGPMSIGDIERTMEVDLDPVIACATIGFRF